MTFLNIQKFHKVTKTIVCPLAPFHAPASTAVHVCIAQSPSLPLPCVLKGLIVENAAQFPEEERQ